MNVINHATWPMQAIQAWSTVKNWKIADCILWTAPKYTFKANKMTSIKGQ